MSLLPSLAVSVPTGCACPLTRATVPVWTSPFSYFSGCLSQVLGFKGGNVFLPALVLGNHIPFLIDFLISAHIFVHSSFIKSFLIIHICLSPS